MPPLSHRRRSPLVDSLFVYPISIRVLCLPCGHRLASQMERHWAGVEGAVADRKKTCKTGTYTTISHK
jgi:hypothetical protein